MAIIGVLALQGDFEKHARMIERVGATPRFVKDAHSLQTCDRLIIPGGESTTFMKLIERLEIRKPLKEFARHKPVFGTCAGCIILASDVQGASFEPLGLIELQVERNAYGRQIDSFIDNINLTLNGKEENFEAVFIRAPKILRYKGSTRPVAWRLQDVVMAANDNILVATFHPELTDDGRIHNYFIHHFPDKSRMSRSKSS